MPTPPEEDTGWTAPSQVMDQDDLDAKITVNVEQVFSEIFMVKILGVLFFVLAGVLAFLPPLLAGEEITTILPSLILGVVGMVFGIIGFFVRSLRKWMILLAPALLIAAVAVRPLTSAVGSLDTMEIILGLAFAVSWFLAVEYLHALSRFVEVGEMAIKRRLSNFNLSGVVKHFLGWGFLMLGIIILVTLGVIGLVPLMGNAFWTMIALGGLLIIVGTLGTIFLLTQDSFTQGMLFAVAAYVPGVVIIVAAVVFVEGEGIIGDSAELWSVFGIAMAAAVVFVMLGLILTVWYTFAEGVAKVEKVEYSREKLQEMLASGQVLDLEDTGTLPGGGETP
ncbi:MAG: hypothetical protein GWN89_05730 [Thermoplasmata archaeon]|nr:hypothetical protein [Thermoplasmata archaeon]NIS11521.1 hypothetical protein [Thermoplasmata archaeon]NIS19439.1 hypothetical protein [Thermoplasmata archaeon]NIT76564.1 hypothetical protein [Thermoplasmata archaeon]NIY02935.1 hypothetical protein [Thermoplasmata archaeon]